MLFEIMECKEGTEAFQQKDAPATALISASDCLAFSYGVFHTWLKGQIHLSLDDEEPCIPDYYEKKINDFVLKMLGEVERFLIHCGNSVSRDSRSVIEVKKQIMNIYGGFSELNQMGIEPKSCHKLNHWPDGSVEIMMRQLNDPEYLPLLRERLKSSKEAELLREDENVFLWAVSGKMVCEKLELLRENEELVKKYIHKKTENGMTPLHFLCRNRAYNNPRAINLLVDMGVDINAQCKEGWTALHDCAYHERTRYGQALFDYGALVYENDRRATPGDIERRITDWPDVNFFFADYEVDKMRIPFPQNKK